MRKLVLILLCASAACAAGKMGDLERNAAIEQRREAAWESVRARHSIFAFRRYLDEFPDSPHEVEARRALDGLRWEEADRDGSERALEGYLGDEPHGSHAADAWARLSALRLSAALQSQSAPRLRMWLAQNPAAAGRDKALQALDEADWREASDPAACRAYLDAHLDGAHRSEAQRRLQGADREEALLLEDEPRLRALDAPAADKLAFDKALALLDEGRLAQLARKPGPFAGEARRALAELQRHGQLEKAAQALYLPRPSLDELPEDAPSRARRLREWALALDGARLHRMLLEISSPRAVVGLAALQSAQQLLQGLPLAEARVRAARELAALQPLAVDAPQLAGIAVLQLALGRDDDALASARHAAGRDPHCAPAVWLAAKLEREPGLAEIAAQALKTHALGLLEAHGALARKGNAAALGELCAARIEAPQEVAIQRALEEGSPKADPCAPPAADDRRAAARTLAAAGTPLARAALARAAARDPDPEVRATATGALAAAVR